MMYGPMGRATEKARQCWQYHNNISNYVKCLFGKEVQKSTTQTTSQDGAASDTNSKNSETTQDTNYNNTKYKKGVIMPEIPLMDQAKEFNAMAKSVK